MLPPVAAAVSQSDAPFSGDDGRGCDCGSGCDGVSLSHSAESLNGSESANESAMRLTKLTKLIVNEICPKTPIGDESGSGSAHVGDECFARLWARRSTTSVRVGVDPQGKHCAVYAFGGPLSRQQQENVSGDGH